MMKLHRILSEIQKLSEEERKIVLRELTNTLLNKKATNPRKITELAGLGKDMWSGVDVDEYLRNERNWD